MMADNKKQIESRRQILRSIVAGGGVATSTKFLPDTWTQPVIDTVLVPSHGQSSPDPNFPTGIFQGGPTEFAQLDQDSDVQQLISESQPNSSVLDFFIDAAEAMPTNSTCVGSPIELMFDIPDNPSEESNVKICLTLDSVYFFFAESTVDGNQIEDVGIGKFALENMEVSLDEVSGDLVSGSCSEPFSAPSASGVFSCGDANVSANFQLIDSGLA